MPVFEGSKKSAVALTFYLFWERTKSYELMMYRVGQVEPCVYRVAELNKNPKICRAGSGNRYHMPLISALGKQRQVWIFMSSRSA